jgi:hypothetical protein
VNIVPLVRVHPKVGAFDGLPLILTRCGSSSRDEKMGAVDDDAMPTHSPSSTDT